MLSYLIWQAKSIEKFLNLHHPDIQFATLELRPLSFTQTELFLRETLKQIRIPLHYLTSDTVNTIVTQSEGIPKNIARLAEEIFQSYQHLLNNAKTVRKMKDHL